MSEPNQVYAEAVLDSSESEISFLKYVCQDKCVFCQSNDCQRKVLRCLHVACKPCIIEHLSGENTLTCVRCHKDTPDPGPGRRLADSLADWPEFSSTDSQPLASGTQSTPFCQQCSDEDEEAAVSKCGECDLYLCDGHSTVHGVSKKSRSHTLTSLQSAQPGSPNCQLHPANPLESVCKTCDILCCAKCITTSGHKDHAVTSTAEYAEAVSHRLGDQMSKINRESALITEEEEEIDSQIASVMNETKTMSETISQRFESRRNALQKKEEEMKNELDKQCWAKLKILEGRKEMVKERRAKQLTSQHLLKSCSGASLVQISPAITCSVEEEKSIAASKPLTAIVLGGRFTSERDDEIAEDTSTICSLSFASTGAELEQLDCASYSYCNLFDPQRKSRGMTVSDQNHVAAACSESECGEAVNNTNHYLWQQIPSIGNYNQGTVRFELECLGDCYDTFLGVTFPNTKPSFPAFAKLNSKLVAWAGWEENMGPVAGGRLGQPWKKGDVIRLKMDCDAHQMTAVHVRSGDQDTIEIPSRYICLSVALCCNESIRLRIPSAVI